MEQPRASQEKNTALLRQLIDDINWWMSFLAPNGWKNSPYYIERESTTKEKDQESQKYFEDFNRMLKEKGIEMPDFMILENRDTSELDEDHELKDLLGSVLWTIFSNNHDVINAEGEVHTLGSFRGSGRFIADLLNEYYPSKAEFVYLDFYCADQFLEDRVEDLRPIYNTFFTRLKAADCDWKYAFPRTFLISFDRPDEEKDDPENYDPATAMQQKLEREEKRKEVAEFQRKLDEDYEARKEEAKYNPPPVIVQCYQEIYGRLPEGYLEE
ncbi:MAG: hypothetical protein AAF847_07460 [Bacteroidota bacterium]